MRYRVKLTYVPDLQFPRWVKYRYVYELQGNARRVLTTGSKDTAMKYAKVEYAEDIITNIIKEGWLKEGWDVGIEVLNLCQKCRNYCTGC